MLFAHMSQTVIASGKSFDRILAIRKGTEISVAPLIAMTARNMTLEISLPIKTFDVTVCDAAGVVLPMYFDMLALSSG